MDRARGRCLTRCALVGLALVLTLSAPVALAAARMSAPVPPTWAQQTVRLPGLSMSGSLVYASADPARKVHELHVLRFADGVLRSMRLPMTAEGNPSVVVNSPIQLGGRWLVPLMKWPAGFGLYSVDGVPLDDGVGTSTDVDGFPCAITPSGVVHLLQRGPREATVRRVGFDGSVKVARSTIVGVGVSCTWHQATNTVELATRAL